MSDRPGDHTLDDLVGHPEREVSDEEVEGHAATEVAAPAAMRRDRDAGAVHHQVTHPIPGAPATGGSTRVHSTATTPIEALHQEEVERTRSFSIIALGIAGAVAVAVPLLDGDPLAEKLLVAGLILAAIPTAWLLYLIRDPAGYTITRVTVVATCLMVAAYTGIFFWGVFSPAPMVIVLGIYFFSLAGSFRATLFVYLACAGTHATLSGLVIAGAMRDRGLITADHLAFHEQVITQAVVQFLFLCAFVIARSSRASTLEAVSRLESAVRSVAQREAQLLEARQDLDRALHVGGPGRFTEQQVGSYELGNLIGRGGMGEVYDATHRASGDPAAVKLLHPHVLSNPAHVHRFVREIDTARSIRSDYVTAVLEVGATEGEVPYMAMERLHGHDLSHHLRRRRRLSIPKVVTLVRQVGKGLAAAHESGIVHRDIKPQNLFLAELPNGRARWKILDFGVSKLVQSGGTLTRGHVVGTPGYMAPEQARGGQLDHRADVYALTAIAYRTLTGRPPFSGKDVPTTLYDVVYKMPPRPSKLADVPRDVELVLAIGLAKDRSVRFDSGEELAEALGNAARGQLSDELRRRANRILSGHPWGTRL